MLVIIMLYIYDVLYIHTVVLVYMLIIPNVYGVYI